MTDPNKSIFVGRLAHDAIAVRKDFAIARIIVNYDAAGKECSNVFTLFFNGKDPLIPHHTKGKKIYVESSATATKEYKDSKGVIHPASVAFIVKDLFFLEAASNR